ncbi:Hypothetical protein, putative [Bodo saltans]|uniref:Uncharacterized protein n=1 Tax=Bodo saltans TaxID=75058 RepID=A0A0S4INY5_BODSA|nr:Hypothetical protein, putative [Bodo saltans]|eukprot:CUE83326.1 Hypothetical protein, putative [Bodo saltans]
MSDNTSSNVRRRLSENHSTALPTAGIEDSSGGSSFWSPSLQRSGSSGNSSAAAAAAAAYAMTGVQLPQALRNNSFGAGGSTNSATGGIHPTSPHLMHQAVSPSNLPPILRSPRSNDSLVLSHCVSLTGVPARGECTQQQHVVSFVSVVANGTGPSSHRLAVSGHSATDDHHNRCLLLFLHPSAIATLLAEAPKQRRGPSALHLSHHQQQSNGSFTGSASSSHRSSSPNIASPRRRLLVQMDDNGNNGGNSNNTSLATGGPPPLAPSLSNSLHQQRHSLQGQTTQQQQLDSSASQSSLASPTMKDGAEALLNSLDRNVLSLVNHHLLQHGMSLADLLAIPQADVHATVKEMMYQHDEAVAAAAQLARRQQQHSYQRRASSSPREFLPSSPPHTTTSGAAAIAITTTHDGQQPPPPPPRPFSSKGAMSPLDDAPMMMTMASSPPTTEADDHDEKSVGASSPDEALRDRTADIVEALLAMSRWACTTIASSQQKIAALQQQISALNNNNNTAMFMTRSGSIPMQPPTNVSSPLSSPYEPSAATSSLLGGPHSHKKLSLGAPFQSTEDGLDELGLSGIAQVANLTVGHAGGQPRRSASLLTTNSSGSLLPVSSSGSGVHRSSIDSTRTVAAPTVIQTSSSAGSVAVRPPAAPPAPLNAVHITVVIDEADDDGEQHHLRQPLTTQHAAATQHIPRRPSSGHTSQSNLTGASSFSLHSTSTSSAQTQHHQHQPLSLTSSTTIMLPPQLSGSAKSNAASVGPSQHQQQQHTQHANSTTLTTGGSSFLQSSSLISDHEAHSTSTATTNSSAIGGAGCFDSSLTSRALRLNLKWRPRWRLSITKEATTYCRRRLATMEGARQRWCPWRTGGTTVTMLTSRYRHQASMSLTSCHPPVEASVIERAGRCRLREANDNNSTYPTRTAAREVSPPQPCAMSTPQTNRCHILWREDQSCGGAVKIVAVVDVGIATPSMTSKKRLSWSSRRQDKRLHRR